MILIRTKLGVSNVQGIGLFADQDIKKGDLVNKDKDQWATIRYTEDQWRELEKSLSKESFRQIKRYAFKNKSDGLYCLNLDDIRFINHSKTPNIATVGENDVALRDIKRGEEITIDYNTFYDDEYFSEIMKM